MRCAKRQYILSFMPPPFLALLGKVVRRIIRLRGGSGSALPGLLVEKIDPHFVRRTLLTLPLGVVLVSGTNGKTTTTKMIVELLQGQGLRVFTNPTGSNFTRGVASALLSEVSLGGKLSADIAVLELDEAHGVHFVRAVAPRHTLLLNVLRDQLDRFGEVDYTAGLLKSLAEATQETLTLNREDPHIRALANAASASVDVRYFGLDRQLQQFFPSDDSLYRFRPTSDETSVAADVELRDFHNSSATFRIDGEDHTTELKLTGAYNIFNAAAALATVRHILQQSADTSKLLATLSAIQPAFGRGEVITLHGQPVELVLVKNPSGFRLGLSSFSPVGYQTMIAINDNDADGRDMSWLWDVSFDSLKETGVAMVSGARSYDMALRLRYDEVETQHVTPDIASALKIFIDEHPDTPKRVYCTYTAMLAIRNALSKLTMVKEMGA
jgi:UDP-N-acetylmuramyl tripeptide synthase